MPTYWGAPFLEKWQIDKISLAVSMCTPMQTYMKPTVYIALTPVPMQTDGMPLYATQIELSLPGEVSTLYINIHWLCLSSLCHKPYMCELTLFNALSSSGTSTFRDVNPLNRCETSAVNACLLINLFTSIASCIPLHSSIAQYCVCL